MSITSLPARLAAPASAIAGSAPVPLTASTMMSPHAAVSATVPIDALPFAPDFHAASLAGSREPRITG